MAPYLLAAVILINGFSLYPYFIDYDRCKEGAVLQKLHRTTTGSDLIVVNPWYMYEVVNYYYRGKARKVGYAEGKGWVDITGLRESNTPFNACSLPPANVPTTKGSVYFIWGIGSGECMEPFQDNPIYVYDRKHNAWRKRTKGFVSIQKGGTDKRRKADMPGGGSSRLWAK